MCYFACKERDKYGSVFCQILTFRDQFKGTVKSLGMLRFSRLIS
jgi:hypothetical protein